ncbi:MAG: Cytochrome b5 domain-containing protein 1 [Thelocarpon superellum]|nr:MAG: Cytochrome b5 domain-containing protein 1 [Thelocarpon superellum]
MTLTATEIAKHNQPSDIWIVIRGKVYDVTDFAPQHPGGADLIFRYAGRDATAAYEDVHPPSILEDSLTAEQIRGTIDESTIASEWSEPRLSDRKDLPSGDDIPPLHTIVNANDFEEVASRAFSKKAWVFYSSAATDLITRDANKTFYDRIWLRPRILRHVGTASTRASILGCDSSAPFFIAPASMAKLAHADGETALARGAAAKGIIQTISTFSTIPVGDLIPAAPLHYPFFFQLYVNSDRVKTETLLRRVSALGVRAIFVTVDAPLAGKREADERVSMGEESGIHEPTSGTKMVNDSKGGGLARLMSSQVDPTLTWDDLAWIRHCTDLPLVLKGIQTAADARLAMEAGVAAIVLSNHGGRSLDTSSPAILVLLELRKCCPEIFDKLEVYVDGGIRRGTDILKALCLGAKGVGVGRPFLYALKYGQQGVEHLIEILRDELQTSMKMITWYHRRMQDHIQEEARTTH